MCIAKAAVIVSLDLCAALYVLGGFAPVLHGHFHPLTIEELANDHMHIVPSQGIKGNFSPRHGHLAFIYLMFCSTAISMKHV